MTIVTESIVEDAALDWFRELGYQVLGGADMAPDAKAHRSSYSDVVLESLLLGALRQLNPELSEDAIEDAMRKLSRPDGASLEARNRSFHRMVVDGVPVEYRTREGALRGAQVRVIDFEKPEANNWLAVNSSR